MRDETEKYPNVLLVIPNLGSGGAQKVFLDQLDDLARHFTVTACVFNWDGSFDTDRQKPIVSLEVPAGKNVFTKIAYFILRIVRLRKLKSQLHTHVCISHLEGADYVNILSKKKERVVCWVHGTKQHDLNIKGLQGLVRKKFLMPVLYSQASQLVAVSNGIASELIQFTRHKETVSVIYNGFDAVDISRQSEEEMDLRYSSIFSIPDVIFTHCRLSQQKNIDALLSILASLKAVQHVKLVIAGDGELREHLLLKCAELRLKTWHVWADTKPEAGADVFFIGQQTNPFKFLRRASLFVMTSQWEGFPLALCEAMACGVPVVVADCFTGPREILALGVSIPQPVSESYTTPYGMLMPLVDAYDAKSVMVWVRALTGYLAALKINVHLSEVSVQRIRQLDIHKSREQTRQLVKESAE